MAVGRREAVVELQALAALRRLLEVERGRAGCVRRGSEAGKGHSAAHYIKSVEVPEVRTEEVTSLASAVFVGLVKSCSVRGGCRKTIPMSRCPELAADRNRGIA